MKQDGTLSVGMSACLIMVGLAVMSCTSISGIDEDHYPVDGGGGGASGTSGGTASISSSTGADSSASSSGSGGAPAPCLPGSTAEIADTFDDNTTDDMLWDTYPIDATHVTVKETNQAMTITTDGTSGVFGGYRSLSKIRSLIGCHMAVEVTQVPSLTEGSYAVRFELRDEAEPMAPNYLRISQAGPNMVFHDYIADIEVSNKIVPYDPVQQRWWRFRESQGKTYFETSPTGADGTWTIQHVIISHPFESALFVNLTMGAKTDLTLNGAASVIFDNLNK